MTNLFDLLSAVARDGERAAGGAVNYDVRWSNDLQRVAVSVGFHKFCHAVTFELVRRKFRRAKIAQPRAATNHALAPWLQFMRPVGRFVEFES